MCRSAQTSTATWSIAGMGPKPGINNAKEHFELGEALGGMDFEAGTKLSGSRFVVLKKGIARMERAIGQFMLDLHTEEHGYTEVQPPLLVRDEIPYGTGNLPKSADDMFRTDPRTSDWAKRQRAR
jgi:seryl-tRNA synthetase